MFDRVLNEPWNLNKVILTDQSFFVDFTQWDAMGDVITINLVLVWTNK